VFHRLAAAGQDKAEELDWLAFHVRLTQVGAELCVNLGDDGCQHLPKGAIRHVER